MRKLKAPLVVALILAAGVPLLAAHPALAADANVTKVEGFIKSIIDVTVSIAGLVATFFIVLGGIHYMTSSGNPERMDKAKHTLLYAAIGLAIVIAAFVISNIVTDLATSAFGS